MRCDQCGTELSGDGRCPACGAEIFAEPRVQVLSQAERNAYTGITIEEGMNEEDRRADIRFERKRGNWGGFSYMTSGGSWHGKLALILGVAALLLFVLFIALPIAMMVVVFSVISWFIYRLLF